MIRLTRLNNTEILLNPDLIEHVELNTDTVVTLTNGSSFVVQEDSEEILQRIVEFKRSLYQSPSRAFGEVIG
jgi:flagellar protein FlbD